MIYQSTCGTCIDFMSKLGPKETLKREFKNLCQACRASLLNKREASSGDSKSNFDNTATETGYLSSFISFTSDYGYVIAGLFSAWIVYASLHRVPPPRPEPFVTVVKPITLSLASR